MKVLHFHGVAGNPRVALALMGQADKTLRPFKQFLSQAVHTAKQRQVRYKLPWQKVVSQRVLKLSALDTRLRVPKPRPGWLITNWPAGRAPQQDQPLMVVSRSLTVQVDRCEATPQGLRIWPDQPLQADDVIFWGGLQYTISATGAAAPPRTVTGGDGRPLKLLLPVSEHGEHWVLTIDGDQAGPFLMDGQEADWQRLQDFEGLQRVFDAAGGAHDCSGELLKLAELPAAGPLRGDNGVRYEWKEQAKSGRDGLWLQLLPPEDPTADELLDPRAAFCEDEVREVWTQPRHHPSAVIKVRRVDRDRYQLLVERLPDQEHEKELYLPVDIRNLELQRRALRQLSEAPLPHHQGLLRLCEDPQHVRWPAVTPKPPPTWYSLTDAERSGTDEQRQFVATALGSPDLTLLEGPPGSGKTTAICELIQQLVLEQKRVLLCASTHAAIDNVIERLLDGAVPIDVLRIGMLDKIDDRVEDCQLDRRTKLLIERWQQVPALRKLGDAELRAMAERTVIMAAHLTCGTTMGIVNHPLFRGRDEDLQRWERPIATLPAWDVLIIDEASKTTIQEFLVPALLARRWVVVGDVRQLPPFADRADMLANLRSLVDDKEREVFLPDHQRARLLLWRLARPALDLSGVRWLITEPAGVLDRLEDELAVQAGPARHVVRLGRPCVGLQQTSVVHVSLDELLAGRAAALHLAAAQWVLVPEDLLPRVSALLPGTLVCARDLSRSLGEADPLLFRQAHALQRAPALDRPVRERGEEFTTRRALEEHEAGWLDRHDWAAELAWRLTRRHELRRSSDGSERQRLERDVERLLPRTVSIEEQVAEIEDIGLPSILEVLQDGIGAERAGRRSALTEGLRQGQPAQFAARFGSLSYQHRMHPDISALPRELFYRDDGHAALRDANTIALRDKKLGWDFLPELRGRRMWRHVAGGESHGANLEEVRRMEEILREFLSWAARKGPPQRDRPRHWEVACLTFYVKQEDAIRQMLQRLTNQRDRQTRFAAPHVEIVCATVDRFQGREADLELLSLRNTARVGFLDSVNRLNVAITRARQQLVILGHSGYFSRCGIGELQELASRTPALEDPKKGARRS